ncbi:hypothetical protein P245_23640 [Comamonas thiooxydans]|uniref:Uncharacterized protein n=1 Tax=Comamonas thiooxydans TaxID=363952 RepID=A0A0E3B9N9_9BURK|nr:hypothetical protein P245_23640 [Comamonas thiooxydans]
MGQRMRLPIMKHRQIDMALAWNLLPFFVKANKQGGSAWKWCH